MLGGKEMREGNSWRPPDWDNPFDLYMAGVIIRPNERAEDYEAGADAVLEALISKTPHPQEVRDRDGKKLGILVFVSEEDTDGDITDK